MLVKFMRFHRVHGIVIEVDLQYKDEFSNLY